MPFNEGGDCCKTILEIVAYVLRYWRLLQNESEKDDTMKACHLMKVVIMELFAKNG